MDRVLDHVRDDLFQNPSVSQRFHDTVVMRAESLPGHLWNETHVKYMVLQLQRSLVEDKTKLQVNAVSSSNAGRFTAPYTRHYYCCDETFLGKGRMPPHTTCTKNNSKQCSKRELPNHLSKRHE